jgi:alpha-glucosidase
MQWDVTTHAGFSMATTRLPLADDYAHENVVNLEADAVAILL